MYIYGLYEKGHEHLTCTFHSLLENNNIVYNFIFQFFNKVKNYLIKNDGERIGLFSQVLRYLLLSFTLGWILLEKQTLPDFGQCFLLYFKIYEEEEKMVVNQSITLFASKNSVIYFRNFSAHSDLGMVVLALRSELEKCSLQVRLQIY